MELILEFISDFILNKDKTVIWTQFLHSRYETLQCNSIFFKTIIKTKGVILTVYPRWVELWTDGTFINMTSKKIHSIQKFTFFLCMLFNASKNHSKCYKAVKQLICTEFLSQNVNLCTYHEKTYSKFWYTWYSLKAIVKENCSYS